MRRPIVTLAKFLSLVVTGAVINIGVAWVGALTSKVYTDKTLISTGAFAIDGRPWKVTRFEGPRQSVNSWDNLRLTGFAMELVPKTASAEEIVAAMLPHLSGWQSDPNSPVRGTFAMPEKPPRWGAVPSGRVSDTDDRLVDASTGWPARSMFCTFVRAGIRNGIVMSGPGTGNPESYQSVPTAPIWPGFAINTLFYAGVLWVLFAGPFALRRMIRRRRGRCPHCAYPIGQSPVCTECGAAVKPQAKAINA